MEPRAALQTFQPGCFTTNKRAKGCGSIFYFVRRCQGLSRNQIPYCYWSNFPPNRTCVSSGQPFGSMVYPSRQTLHYPLNIQLRNLRISAIERLGGAEKGRVGVVLHMLSFVGSIRKPCLSPGAQASRVVASGLFWDSASSCRRGFRRPLVCRRLGARSPRRARSFPLSSKLFKAEVIRATENDGLRKN